MLDIRLIRKDPDFVREQLLKRMDEVDLSPLLKWDEKRRNILVEVEQLKAEKNKVSSQIPKLKREGKDVEAVFSAMRDLNEKIKIYDEDANQLQEKVNDFIAILPNLPALDVIGGGKENNEVVSIYGSKPQFDFKPQNHVDLVESLGLVDYERGVKLGGRGFWLYKGDGALLEWAMLNYFIDEHRKGGYEFLLPPHILTNQCGYTAGQFPKFADDVFLLKGSASRSYEQFLLPTAETALVNVHRDEILTEEELPIKYYAYTPCFRREAGSYRAEERGMIRGHQFNKVELLVFTRPEDSAALLDELIEKAENLVQGLGLHYRLSKLAAGDVSAAMAKTFDIEVWIPSMGEYKEVSSASNAHDYQARRGMIRFRREETKRTEYVHTLNASGLATSRLLPAIVEQFQQVDGSVIVPEVLRPYLGKDRLTPKK